MSQQIPATRHAEPVVFLRVDLSSLDARRAANADVAAFYERYGDTHIIKEETQTTHQGSTYVVLQATCIVRFFEGQQLIGISSVRAQAAAQAYAQQLLGPQVQPGAASQVPPPPPAKKGLFRG